MHVSSLNYGNYVLLQSGHTIHYFYVQKNKNEEIQTVIKVYNKDCTFKKDINLQSEYNFGDITIIATNIPNEILVIKTVIIEKFKKLILCQFLDVEGNLTRGAEFILSNVTSDIEQTYQNIYTQKTQDIIYIATFLYQNSIINPNLGIQVSAINLNDIQFKISQQYIYYSRSSKQNLDQNNVLLQVMQDKGVRLIVYDSYNTYYQDLFINETWPEELYHYDRYIQWSLFFGQKIYPIEFEENVEKTNIQTTLFFYEENSVNMVTLNNQVNYICANKFLKGHTFQGRIQTGIVDDNIVWAKINMDSYDYIMFFNPEKCIFYEQQSFSLLQKQNQMIFNVAQLNFNDNQYDNLTFIINSQTQAEGVDYNTYLIHLDINYIKYQIGMNFQKYEDQNFQSPIQFHQFNLNPANKTEITNSITGNGQVEFISTSYNCPAINLNGEIDVIPIQVEDSIFKFLTHQKKDDKYSSFQIENVLGKYLSISDTNVKNEIAVILSSIDQINIRFFNIDGSPTRKSNENSLLIQISDDDYQIFPGIIQTGSKLAIIQFLYNIASTNFATIYQIYINLENKDEIEIKTEHQYRCEGTFSTEVNIFSIYEDDSVVSIGYDSQFKQLYQYQFEQEKEDLIDKYNEKLIKVGKNYDIYQKLQFNKDNVENFTMEDQKLQNPFQINEFVILKEQQTTVLLQSTVNITSNEVSLNLQYLTKDGIQNQMKQQINPNTQDYGICQTNQEHEVFLVQSVLVSSQVKLIYAIFYDNNFKLTRGRQQIIAYVQSHDLEQQNSRIIIKQAGDFIYVATQVVQQQQIGLLVAQIDISNKDYFIVLNREIFYLKENQNNFGDLVQQIYLQGYQDKSATIIVRSVYHNYYIRIKQEDNWDDLEFNLYANQGLLELQDGLLKLQTQKFNEFEDTFMVFVQYNYLAVQTLDIEGNIICSNKYYEYNFEISGLQVIRISDKLVIVLGKFNKRTRLLFFNPNNCMMYYKDNYSLRFSDNYVVPIVYYDEEKYLQLIQYSNYKRNDPYIIHKSILGNVKKVNYLLEKNYENENKNSENWKNPLSHINYGSQYDQELKDKIDQICGIPAVDFAKQENFSSVKLSNGNLVMVFQPINNEACFIIYDKKKSEGNWNVFKIASQEFTNYDLVDTQNNDEQIFVVARSTNKNMYAFYMSYNGNFLQTPIQDTIVEDEDLIVSRSKKGNNLTYILIAYQHSSIGYHNKVVIVDASKTNQIVIKDQQLLLAPVQPLTDFKVSQQLLQVYNDDQAVILTFFSDHYLIYKYDENGKLLNGYPLFRQLEGEFIPNQVICTEAKIHSDQETSTAVLYQSSSQLIMIIQFDKNGEIIKQNIYDFQIIQNSQYKYLTSIKIEIINDFLFWIHIGFYNQYDQFRDAIFFGNTYENTIDLGQYYKNSLFMGKIEAYENSNEEYVIIQIGKHYNNYQEQKVVSINFKSPENNGIKLLNIDLNKYFQENFEGEEDGENFQEDFIEQEEEGEQNEQEDKQENQKHDDKKEKNISNLKGEQKKK